MKGVTLRDHCKYHKRSLCQVFESCRSSSSTTFLFISLSLLFFNNIIIILIFIIVKLKILYYQVSIFKYFLYIAVLKSMPLFSEHVPFS